MDIEERTVAATAVDVKDPRFNTSRPFRKPNTEKLSESEPSLSKLLYSSDLKIKSPLSAREKIAWSPGRKTETSSASLVMEKTAGVGSSLNASSVYGPMRN